MTKIFYIMAHRGDQQRATENTSNAFKSMSRFVDVMKGNSDSSKDFVLGAEFDIQLIGDQLICYHDTSFDRVHSEFKNKSFSFDTIKEINKDSINDIPSFEKVLQIFCDIYKDNNFLLNIELKSFEITLAIKVVELVHKYDLVNKAILTSFYPNLVEYVTLHHPEFKTGFLMSDVREFDKYVKGNSWVNKVNYLIFNVKSLLAADKQVVNNFPFKLGVYTIDSDSYASSQELFSVIKDYPNLDLMMTDNVDNTLLEITNSLL